jgi:hypothetical protein
VTWEGDPIKTLAKLTVAILLVFLLGLSPVSTVSAGSKDDFFSNESSPLGPFSELDAQGPYGTDSDPHFEGNPTTFEANILDGDVSDYYFRWDADNDGIWEKDDFGATKGQPSYSHEYPDDYIGLAKVEAWDGISYRDEIENRFVLDGATPSSFESPGVVDFKTIGMKFMAKQDFVVNQLGVYNDPSNPYEIVFNIRLWTESGSLISSLTFPEVPPGSWSWFDIIPVALSGGNSYVVSLGIRGTLIPSDSNPGTTFDGYLEPSEFVYFDGSPFAPPMTSFGSDPIPLLDIRYEFTYPVPDILKDYADVYVDNVAPTVSAGSDITGFAGEPVYFFGEFTDPGSADTHEIIWCFEDGNHTYGDLTPSHTYLIPGIYNVTLKVTDDDGGEGADTLTVTIEDPRTTSDYILELMDNVDDLDVNGGTKNSLVSKLENTLKSHEKENKKAAINQLSAFILSVKAQKGKKLSDDEAEELIDFSNEIIEMMIDGL